MINHLRTHDAVAELRRGKRLEQIIRICDVIREIRSIEMGSDQVNQRTHRRIIIAHHLILHGYGHWLPNDPRGSGSDAIRDEKFASLGAIHHGRKRVQPPRGELKQFYRDASPLLDFPPIWFDDAKRQAIAGAFATVIAREKYTVWACAILKNHAHLCIRRHRDDALVMWQHFAEESSRSLRLFVDVPADHRIWSTRPYKVFLYDADDVRRVISYIDENPSKEGLSRQSFSFINVYDGFPFRGSDAKR